MSSEPPASIAVIGAGILGLTSANLLQEHFSRLPDPPKFTLIASELPGDPATLSVDYASPWAGAHYRPNPGNSPQLRFERDLAMRTYDKRKLEVQDPSAGIKFLPGEEYLESPTPAHYDLKTGEPYAGLDDEFRVLDRSELPQGARWGCRYKTYVVNPEIYCAHLLQRFIDGGGRVVKKRLNSSPEEAFRLLEPKAKAVGVQVVVNCTGHHGFEPSTFSDDPYSFPTRGQTVLVRNKCDKTITRQNSDGSWTFLVPRPGPGGGTIVGGTKEVRDLLDKPRPGTRERLLQMAEKHFVPREILKEKGERWDVVRDIVGRRPTREGGLRLEVDEKAGRNGKRRIVHAYGAGGRGYELSWGIAEEVFMMVEEGLQEMGRSKL